MITYLVDLNPTARSPVEDFDILSVEADSKPGKHLTSSHLYEDYSLCDIFLEISIGDSKLRQTW